MNKIKFVSSALLFASVPALAGNGIDTQLLTSGQIDLAADTITLPLHQGALADGRSVWYILTDASDAAAAKAQGLVYAPALDNATQGVHTRTATVGKNGDFVFDQGTVDFSPVRAITAGASPNLFPPKAAQPGSLGDAAYSPYVRVGSVVYNAPMIAFNVGPSALAFCGTGAGTVDHNVVHDKVVSLCASQRKVTIALSHGFASGRPLVYISLDANDPTAATMEGATYAPSLSELKGTGSSLPLYAVANGETGTATPARQGFDSALLGEGSPLNILTGIPSLDSGYTPLWDLHIGQWTAAAVAAGKRTLLTSVADVQAAIKAGDFTGFGGGALGASGLLVNCPAVAVLK